MPSKEGRIMTKEKLALYGVIGAALIGLIGVVISSITQTTLIWVPATQTAQSVLSTQTATAPQPRLILSDTFDDNRNDWDIDFETSILGGVIQKTLETDSGGWSTVEIPGISEKNFCLIFDARLTSISDSATIVIVMRGINYEDMEKRNYIRLSMSDNGKGTLWARKDSDDEQRIVQIDTPAWSDGNLHTLQIAMLDNTIEIRELNSTNSPPQRIVLDDDKAVSEQGVIRLGLGVPMPRENASVEFDNLFLYNICP